jgi:nicotinate-nucleotide pyrophosphorylase (carboxylating)
VPILQVFNVTYHHSVEWHVDEGELIHPIKHCATVRGAARKILLGERVALNTLARCSGIATKYVLLIPFVFSFY